MLLIRKAIRKKFTMAMALNSKRMQTFFNEFLITTTSFLNQFANECEDKFFELERKLTKIESNLIIIEQKVKIKKNFAIAS